MKSFMVIVLFAGMLRLSVAQNKSDLIRYFQESDYVHLKKELGHLKSGSYEQRFFKAVFETDATKAFDVYKDIFKNSTGYTRYFAAGRLKDYYYARGFYATAADYQKFLVEHRDLLDTENHLVKNKNFIKKTDVLNQEKLYIQVGAFGLKENAIQMQQMLGTQKIESKIVLRKINEKKLYCVWIPGKDGFKPTLNFANELMEKYHLKYRLIKE